jgi:hypothetical protein
MSDDIFETKKERLDFIKKVWTGLPPWKTKPQHKTITVVFETEEYFQEFVKLNNIKFTTPNVKSFFWPATGRKKPSESKWFYYPENKDE